MSYAKQNMEEADASRRKIFIIIALVVALPIAGLVYWVTRSSPQSGPPRLENALRPGSPEFEGIRERVVVEFDPDTDATEGERALGDVVMTMTPTIRNFTRRPINGLELRAIVVDLQGQPVQEKTVVRQVELENNEVTQIPITMEGFKKTDTRANIKIELTGVRFK
ncbi:MAG: hypothetical protein ACR2GW_06370 [Pyrinomonadaceae bacterium]|nr:hypothetical protein [Pyrinomonadaceae bacterium]